MTIYNLLFLTYYILIENGKLHLSNVILQKSFFQKSDVFEMKQSLYNNRNNDFTQ